jgi:type IV pilus assembly protein PilA
MTNELGTRARSESGFTLAELLVVMLIIGLLAAIAIPAFFNQRNKANDAGAKETVRTMQTAEESFATSNLGSYTGGSLAALNKIETTLVATACVGAANGCPKDPTITGSGTGYTVSYVAKTTGNVYSITRSGTGALAFGCQITIGGDAGGCSNVVAATGVGTWN